MNAGYLSANYVYSLKEWGEPVYLPHSRGWVLERQIPNYYANDAMGCYPLFLCENWSSLDLDLEQVGEKWVTLSIVTDPFGDYTIDYLRKCFPDKVIPFKRHYIIDLTKQLKDYVNEHHLRNVRKALQKVTVEICSNPLDALEDWVRLYDVLIKRHNIRGMTAFSRQSFASQLQVPGLVAFRAIAEDETVGMLLWYVVGNRAYYHLGAYSETGYSLRASFALFWYAINYFAELGLGWLNLGGGAGLQGAGVDGLSRFKRGWSNSTRLVYFCGRVFDHAKYHKIICLREGLPDVDYFPLYRYGEF